MPRTRILRETKLAPSEPALDPGRCYYLCRWIEGAKGVQPFKHPVDAKKDGAPDYYVVIKSPMDLHTLSKYAKGESFSFGGFLRKSRLIWSNTHEYNSRDHLLSKTAASLQKLFEQKIMEMQKHPSSDAPQAVRSHMESLVRFLKNEEAGAEFHKPTEGEGAAERPIGLDDVEEWLKEELYYNRYDVGSDLMSVFKDALQGHGSTSVMGILANHMHSIAVKQFELRLDDVSSRHMILPCQLDTTRQNFYELNDYGVQEVIQFIRKEESISAICLPDGRPRLERIEALNQRDFYALDNCIRRVLTSPYSGARAAEVAPADERGASPAERAPAKPAKRKAKAAAPVGESSARAPKHRCAQCPPPS